MPSSFFFFNDTATTEIYTLSLHDALPIFRQGNPTTEGPILSQSDRLAAKSYARSEEHTSELQSRPHLVCRLLLEKKKNIKQKESRLGIIKLGPHSACNDQRYQLVSTHATC